MQLLISTHKCHLFFVNFWFDALFWTEIFLASPQGCLREGSSTPESSSVMSWCILMVRGERTHMQCWHRSQKGSPPFSVAHPALAVAEILVWLLKPEFPLQGQAGVSPKHRTSSCLFILYRIPYLLVRPVSGSVSESWIIVWGKSIVLGVRRASPSTGHVILALT